MAITDANDDLPVPLLLPLAELIKNAPRSDGYTNNRMQLQAQELGQVRIRAIQTISHDNVVGPQQMVQALHDEQLVLTHRRRNQVEQGAGDQIEQGHELRHRELVSALSRRPMEQEAKMGTG